MNYLELLRNVSPKHELSFMSIATTGVRKDDQIIAVFLGKEEGPIAGMACEGITDSQLDGTFRYHRISKQLYDNMIKVPKEVMYRSLCNFFSNDVIVSYNLPFMSTMIHNLTDTHADYFEMIDICRVCQWIQSGQIFNTVNDANYGKLKALMDEWRSPQSQSLKNTLSSVTPTYLEDLSKPAPEAAVEALRYLCRSLEKKQVLIAQG